MTLADDLQTLADREADPSHVFPQEPKSLWECRLCLDDAKATIALRDATIVDMQAQIDALSPP